MKKTAPTCARRGCVKTTKYNASRSTWALFCSKDCSNSRHTAADSLKEPAAVQLDTDRAARRAADERAVLKQKYEIALKTIESQEHELQAHTALKAGLDTFKIEPRLRQGTSEGTVVVLASDWHIEERVGAEVGGLNTYSLAIAKQRATKFFQATLRLLTLLQQDITIQTVVLALLGDFITNDIHDGENAEANEITPMMALTTAQSFLISGIEFLLEHSKVSLVIPCHSGNHARTTKKTRFGAENGHSLEYLLYVHLAAYFRHEPRITFLIADGMHSYVDVYSTTIRFQHGHAIKYGGGVGGIYIPVNKAIAMWDRARPASLNCFGHFHQLVDGGNFVANGSLIGYNSFALSIKAAYEKPKQALFLIDKKRGRTANWPILVED